MDNDLIVVEVHDFQHITSSQDASLRKKAEWLKSTFECFKSDAVPQWKKKGVVMSKPMPVQRQKIGNKELSCEAIARKDIMSLMNKLTATNKDHIFNQLKSSLRENYAELYVKCIWDFMLLCPEQQNVYSDILLQLSCYIDVHSTIQQIWEEYVSDKAWIPPNTEPDDLHDYDVFCDHVKWKKQSIAKVKGWMIFCKRLLLPNSCQSVLGQELFCSCDTFINKQQYKGADIAAEQLTAFVQSCNSPDDAMVNCVSCWKNVATSFPPSLRFKIYDLYDLVHRKNEVKK